MSITLVLVGDHPIVLDALRNLFQQEPDLQVLAHCTKAEEVVRVVSAQAPDVLILDLEMPRAESTTVLREIRDRKLATRTVFLTGHLDEEELLEALRWGVAGVVLKEMDPRQFVQCVRKVHAGEQWFERRSMGRVVERLLQREAALREVAAVLTPREIELVRMVAGELSNKEVADRLCISEGTVKAHLHNIYEKLRLGGRRDLARYAVEKGLVGRSYVPSAAGGS